jgi:hypothetical protein
MRCFTDADLRRGLAAVIARWDACVVCGGRNDDWHELETHPFQPPDLLTLLLEATQAQPTVLQ